MKTLIVSDIHANLPALEAVLKDTGTFDNCLFIGDSVTYGSFPKEVLRFLRENMSHGVMGNHDNAAANGEDSRCRADFKTYADETLKWHMSLVDQEDLMFLRSLPIMLYVHVGDLSVYMTHGSPEGNMFRYLTGDQIGKTEIEGLERQGFIILGHTHYQYKKTIGKTTVFNPGSVGLSREDHNACYAILQDGQVILRRVPYENRLTVLNLMKSPVSNFTKEGLSNIIGWVPPKTQEKR